MELRDEAGRPVVRLDIDTSANGQRLRITSVPTGEVRFADALMLEALIWLSGDLGEERTPS